MTRPTDNAGVPEREAQYYEEFYAGEAQQHFAKPAVVAFREHLVRRILKATGVTRGARVLSIGCGVGDTELLLAPHVGEIVGIDLSARAIAQARSDALRRRIGNATFRVSPWQRVAGESAGRFDLVLAIFFLHHLDDAQLAAAPARLKALLTRGGALYALDPSSRRLSGAVGRLLVPRLMAKYQTEDERPLRAKTVERAFAEAGFLATTHWYDFVSTPLAGLFPEAPRLYRAGRWVDEVLVRTPALRELSSNFELVAVNGGRVKARR